MEDRPGDHPFLDGGVHLFRRAPELMHRIKLTSVLLQVEHDPRLRAGDIGPSRRSSDTATRRSDRLADDPECRDIGPLDDAATAELDDRRIRWAAALAGKVWRPPQPMELGRRGRRL